MVLLYLEVVPVKVGSSKGSHVLDEILSVDEANDISVRFSFSKNTTKEEIDFTVLKLKELLI